MVQLQSNKVKRTPQDYINEFIIWIIYYLNYCLKRLVFSLFGNAMVIWFFENGTC